MSGKAIYQFDKRPIVWVRLENPHDSSTASVDVPALVDTGADFSAIPASFAPLYSYACGSCFAVCSCAA